MLKINAIKIEITTPDGLYGFAQNFQKGLNIIRGNNSSGKSSLFQAILYALGLEELLGGKNEKTMQSVLKDQVEFPDSELHKIIQSDIYLEIENEEAITIKRAIISPTDSPKLVNVCKYLKEFLVTKLLLSSSIPPIDSVTHVGSPANISSYPGVLRCLTSLNLIIK